MFPQRIFFFLLITFFIAACGGGGGGDDDNGDTDETPDSGVTPVVVNRSLTLAMTTESTLDRTSGEIILVDIRSIANDDSVLEEKTLAASPANGSNVSSEWSLLSDVKLDEHGGRLVVNASANGFIEYGASHSYSAPTDVELRGEMVETRSVSIDIPALRARARSSAAVEDQYIRLRLSRNIASGKSQLRAGRSISVEDNTVDDLVIDIPVDEIPSDVTRLDAEMRGFDSSDAQDSLYFPGEYADSDGNELLSIAFDFVELTDQEGRSLGEVTSSARANRLVGRDVEPTIITRRIPVGSCPAVNSLGDANNDQNGLQIPVYTYNPNSGEWDLLGYGTVYDTADVSPAEGFLDCDNQAYYLSIEVDNGDFLRSWWNLDYPLVFAEPVELCVKVKLVDVNGSPITGVWVSLYDDDGRSFSTQYGYTDENGEVLLTTVLLDGTDTDRSANLRFWSYNDGNYRTETVQLSENCASDAEVIELAHLDLCTVEGKTVLDTDTSVGMPGAILYAFAIDGINFDYKYFSSNDEGFFRSSVLCETDYTLYSWSFLSAGTFEFNVNNELAVGEVSDDGQKVVVDNIMIENSAPLGYLYLYGGDEAGTQFGENNVTATIEAGSRPLYFWAYDYDGHFPVTYRVTIDDSVGNQIASLTGTIDGWGEAALIDEFDIPSTGDYDISVELTDSLGAQGSATIYVWPFETSFF